MSDIKETKEFIAGLKEGAKAGKKIRDIVKDGIDAGDLPKAFELVKEQAEKAPVYSAAVADIAKIKEEIKDLDKNEVVEIVMQIVSAVSEIEDV